MFLTGCAHYSANAEQWQSLGSLAALTTVQLEAFGIWIDLYVVICQLILQDIRAVNVYFADNDSKIARHMNNTGFSVEHLLINT
jgi:hypothetical protein